MLEDDFTDVIGKALRGLGLSPEQAAVAAGLDAVEVTRLLGGRWDEATARALARVLGLGEEALAAHPAYVPPVCDHPAITRLDLPFGGYSVNAWLLDAADGWLLIDAGCDEDSLARAIREGCGVGGIRRVILTHDHRDHVGGLRLFDGGGVPVHGPGVGRPWMEMRPGESFACGALEVTAHDLSGHAVPALGLEIRGLDVPVLAVGDALFAGSMGGCEGRERYDLARKTLGDLLARMDPQTLLLPGHGPPTRVVEELRSNPFVAGLTEV
jgi:hydroxyacylglutathione hydrolase